MTLYLTYEEYLELGGKQISEIDFNNVCRKAQRLLDYITFNRIQKLTTIPEEVKDVLTEFINRSVTVDGNGEMQDFDNSVSKYSNGVETIEYKLKTETENAEELKNLAYRWLPDWLVARGVSFDVEKYLQSANNNP